MLLFVLSLLLLDWLHLYGDPRHKDVPQHGGGGGFGDVQQLKEKVFFDSLSKEVQLKNNDIMGTHFAGVAKW